MEKEFSEFLKSCECNLIKIKKIVVDQRGFDRLVSHIESKINPIFTDTKVSIHSLNFKGILIEKEK